MLWEHEPIGECFHCFSRFRSVREEDLDSLLVEAVPEKTKVATEYGMKIFHVRTAVENDVNEFITH